MLPSYRKRLIRNIPLRWVLVLPFVLLTTGAVSLVGYLSYRNAYQVATRLANQSIEKTGELVNQNLNRHLAMPGFITQTTAYSLQVGHLNQSDLAGLQSHFAKQLNLLPELGSLAIANEAGDFLAIERLQSESLVIRRFDHQSRDRAFHRYLANAQGENLVLQEVRYNFDPHNDPPGNPWYEEARQAKRGVWRILVSLAQGEQSPMLIAAHFYPFYDAANNFQGVVAGTIYLTRLGNFLHEINTFQSGQVLLVENNGLMIATSTGEIPFDSRPNPVHQQNVAVRPRRLDLSQSQNPLTRALATHFAKTGSFTQINPSQTATFWFNQQRHFVRVTPLQSDLNWFVVVAVAESEFLGEIDDTVARTVLLSWLTLFAATAIGILTARWITKPIFQLSRASQALAQGASPQVLSENISIVELKTLAGCFNQTAAQLHQSFSRIKTALQESEEKFTTIFRTTPDPIAILTFRGGQILDVNNRATEFCGFTSDEIVGRTALELGLWANLEQRDRLIETLHREGTICNVEVDVQTKTRELKTVLMSAEVCELNKQACIILVFRDISDRKRAEAALQDSEERFREIASTINQIFFVQSATTKQYLYVSPAYEKIWGYPCESIYKYPEVWKDNIHIDDRERVLHNLEQRFEGHQIRHEYRIIRSDATIRWVSTEINGVYDKAGNLIRFVGITEDITDRKRGELALKQALQEIDTHFQESPLAIVQWDRDFHILRWSKQAERLFGWTAAEVNSLPWKVLEIVHTDDRDWVKTTIAELLDGSVHSQALRNRNYTKDGRVLLCQWYSSAVFDEQGNLVSVLSFGEDVTAREQAEAALSQSEAQMRAILTAIPDLIFLYTLDGIFLNAIRKNSFLDLIRDPNPVGKHIDELVSREVADRQQQAVQAVIATGEPQIYEQEVWMHGRVQYEEVRIVACGDQAVVVIVRDIGDRKLREIERQIADAALRESEERLRRAFDDAAIGMAWVSLNGRFLKVSQSLCEIVGYSEEELLSLRFQDISHPDDLSFDQELAERMFAGDQRTYQREKRYIHKQGHTVWILVNVSLVKDRNDKPLYFVSQIQDISDRHKLDQIKDEFISIVSHELRTPLTAIRGSLGILDAGVLDDDPKTAREMLQVAVNNSDRLVRLVNDILDLERLESGRIELVTETCSVDELLQQALESVQALALQSNITIQVTAPMANVTVAPDAIVQAIVNLVGNAIKFSPQGSTIWLKAEISREDAESRSPLSVVCFSIQDQGRGIPAEKLESIFGRFQQVDVSDSRQRGGTGLGLAICRSIVQQHGGKIWAESVVGQGSTFYFTIPLAREAK
jgi:PAS domain S-box-containing protein